MKLPLLLCASLLAAFACTPVWADDIRLPVPNQGWSVRFDGPPFAKISEHDTPQQYALTGNSGRFNVSLLVEPPKCEGGESQEAIYKCFNASLMRNPAVIYSTERGSALPEAVMVAYLTQMEVDGRKVRAFNVDVLFSHAGKWGDLHVSYVSPEAADVSRLYDLAKSFDIVDDAVPAAPAGASASH